MFKLKNKSQIYDKIHLNSVKALQLLTVGLLGYLGYVGYKFYTEARPVIRERRRKYNEDLVARQQLEAELLNEQQKNTQSSLK